MLVVMVRKEQGTVRVNGMCHSFTGKEQSLRCTRQCLSISSRGGGAVEIREILILFSILLFYTRSFSNFLDNIMNPIGKIKLVIMRKKQQTSAQCFRYHGKADKMATTPFLFVT